MFKELFTEGLSEKDVIEEMKEISATIADKDGWFVYEIGGMDSYTIYNKLKKSKVFEERWNQMQGGMDLAMIRLLKGK